MASEDEVAELFRSGKVGPGQRSLAAAMQEELLSAVAGLKEKYSRYVSTEDQVCVFEYVLSSEIVRTKNEGS